MDTNINEDALKILAYFHENATGYTEESQEVPGEVAEAMGMEWKQFQKAASYLASFGLLGKDTADASSTDGVAYLWNGIWLTGHGENYMRQLEKEPGVARRLTVKTVSELWGVGKGVLATVAGQVLTQFLRTYHG